MPDVCEHDTTFQQAWTLSSPSGKHCLFHEPSTPVGSLTYASIYLILVTLEVGVVISFVHEELRFTVTVVVQVTDLKIGRAGI